MQAVGLNLGSRNSHVSGTLAPNHSGVNREILKFSFDGAKRLSVGR